MLKKTFPILYHKAFIFAIYFAFFNCIDQNQKVIFYYMEYLLLLLVVIKYIL